MSDPVAINDIVAVHRQSIVYSFCTLVTRLDEYRDMVTAFSLKGFTDSDCEFLYADNSASNRFDAFSAYNRFLLEARGHYIVLCHQDILPLEDDRKKLDTLLEQLTASDAHWALCGNAGMQENGQSIACITDPHVREPFRGSFPVKVMSLDENFIVVRRDANLALSRDLTGFHWYGSDLCVVADILGWNAYVIGFHLLHKSAGKLGSDFRPKGYEFRRKYSRAFRARWQYVPVGTSVYLSGSPLGSLMARAWRKLLRLLGSKR